MLSLLKNGICTLFYQNVSQYIYESYFIGYQPQHNTDDAFLQLPSVLKSQSWKYPTPCAHCTSHHWLCGRAHNSAYFSSIFALIKHARCIYGQVTVFQPFKTSEWVKSTQAVNLLNSEIKPYGKKTLPFLGKQTDTCGAHQETSTDLSALFWL